MVPKLPKSWVGHFVQGALAVSFKAFLWRLSNAFIVCSLFFFGTFNIGLDGLLLLVLSFRSFQKLQHLCQSAIPLKLSLLSAQLEVLS